MRKLPILLPVLAALLGLVALSACERGILDDRNVASLSDGLVFETGTSFGLCGGYCRTELRVQKSGFSYVESGRNFGGDALPDRHYEGKISAAEWQAIVEAYDPAGFAGLDTIIGCPDCADGGAEWLRVESANMDRRVTFEHGANIEPILHLMHQLRLLRASAEENLRAGNATVQPVVITDLAPDSIHLDPFSLEEAFVAGDTLHLRLSHGGGCANHEYRLFMSPAAFMESYPVQANLYLQHNGNNDMCDALLMPRLQFDLRPIAEAYRASYRSDGPVLLNLHGYKDRNQRVQVRFETK